MFVSSHIVMIDEEGVVTVLKVDVLAQPAIFEEAVLPVQIHEDVLALFGQRLLGRQIFATYLNDGLSDDEIIFSELSDFFAYFGEERGVRRCAGFLMQYEVFDLYEGFISKSLFVSKFEIERFSLLCE